jgi:hypothetical protein
MTVPLGVYCVPRDPVGLRPPGERQRHRSLTVAARIELRLG